MTTSTSNLLFVDLETFSSVDIKESGLYRYTESPDFEILLLSYAFGDEEVKILDLFEDRESEEYCSVVAAILSPAVTKVAHNAAFERTCLAKWLGTSMPINQWEDTMVLAQMNGLPGSLEACGAALGLEQQKMAEGKQLIRYFCKPCRATKANGGRTRNLPSDAPEKWKVFKDYCVRDVVVAIEIYNRLKNTKVTETERKVRAVDAAICERGVLCDTDFVESCAFVDQEVKGIYEKELIALTGVPNPNSPYQLKTWLEYKGFDIPSLNKKAVSEMIPSISDKSVKRALELRQLLGKTSTAKYTAMQHTTCSDNRIRGLLQYYGASKTGRWSGRLVQLQNLPQNHLVGIEDVRSLVKDRDVEALMALFNSVPDVLSQLVRTAFVAESGKTFLVADYHAIEAVCIAYLAKEKWRLDVFSGDGKIYEASYARAFHVPVESIKKGSPERQKGKVLELACIAEGQKVLTDKGLVPIEKVTREMRVWDGENWVHHDGVIYRGIKEVFAYDGLIATPDHLVWVEGKPEPIYFGVAATSGAHLTKTGDGRNPIRLGEKLERRSKKVRVYDIRNAGPNNRFTVSGKLVHNCGYGGGVNAMKAFGADKLGLTDDELQHLVSKWREASPNICRLWRLCESAAKDALDHPGVPYKVPGVVTYFRDKNTMWAELPSGRRLSYWGARIEDRQIVYMSQNQTTRKWESTTTWGGKLVENIVQAFARDILAWAMVRLEEKGFKIVFHVHDEIITEMPEGTKWEDQAKIMEEPVPWAPELAKYLTADGYETKFYRKD